MAWQSGNALGVFLVGTLFQAIISIQNPDYSAPRWQGTLLVIASTLIAFVGTVFGSRVLHTWQNAVFIFHIVLLFVFIVPIWVKVPSISHGEVWSEFENYGGWSSMLLSVFAGQLTGISNELGIDTVSKEMAFPVT